MTCPNNPACNYPAGQCDGSCADSYSTRRVRSGTAPAVAPAFIKAAPRKPNTQPKPHTQDPTGERATAVLLWLAIALVAAGLVIQLT
jgi:hypothetical protein